VRSCSKAKNRGKNPLGDKSPYLLSSAPTKDDSVKEEEEEEEARKKEGEVSA
jgi:hypothetical protein